MSAMTPEQVAAGLTKAQRRIILAAREPTGRGKWPLRNALSDKGISVRYPWRLTVFGLAVREILKSQDAQP